MANKYVIRGLFEDQNTYYVGVYDSIDYFGIPIIQLTTDLKYATTFDDKSLAKKALNNVSKSVFKIYPVCPRCHKEYDGYPAISREDNKTKICSKCGQDEALEEFNKYYNLIY